MKSTKHTAFITHLLLALALSCTAALANAAAENVELPKSSVYQLATPLVDQNGNSFLLAARRGQPMLVSMFYTSCQYTCPLLISALKHTEAKLTADERRIMVWRSRGVPCSVGDGANAPLALARAFAADREALCSQTWGRGETE